MMMNKAAGPGRGPGAFSALPGVQAALAHRPATPFVASTAPRLVSTVIRHVPMPDLPLTGRSPADPALPHRSARTRAGARGRDVHHGTVHVGLHADPAASPDLDLLAQHFGTALGALLAC
jgi:diacylglycerol O-acyltransferase